MFKAISNISRKTLAVSLVALFIVAAIFLISPAKLFAGLLKPDEVWVDDDWDGLPDLTDVGGVKVIGMNAFSTIQLGVDNVADDGHVYIAAGTYNEAVHIYGSEIAGVNIEGAGASSTIVIGFGVQEPPVYAPVFYIYNSEVSIDNLTIKNGDAVDGGGIYSYGSDVVITNCVIKENAASNGLCGGGIYNINGYMEIHDCLIKDNTADISGGGVCNWNGGTTATMEIYDSQIIDNTAVNYGGGIFNHFGEVSIVNSCISGNSASVGSGVYDELPNLTIDARNNYWGSSSGPSGGIEDINTPGEFANGTGDSISGEVYFYPWLTSCPFAPKPKHKTEPVVVEPVWIRDHPMTCNQVWVNENGCFEFVFFWEYRDNNWVKIYDMEDKLVYELDFPYGTPRFEVDLPDGMYTVKTFHNGFENPIQEFIIGKS